MKEEWIKLQKSFYKYQTFRGLRTVKKTPYLLKPFFTYLLEQEMEIEEVTYKKASEFQTHLVTLENEQGEIHYSSPAVRDIVGCAKSFYRFLRGENLCFENPFYGLKLVQREQKLPRNIPNEKQMDKFLENLRCFWKGRGLKEKRGLYKLHVMAELQYSSGLRIDEVAKLETSDIDYNRNIIHVREGKGGGERTAYLSDYASKVLKIYVEQMRNHINFAKKGRNIFGVKNGNSLNCFLNPRLKEAGKKAGIMSFTSHTFRHALGSHCLRRGCDLRYIQLFLGHKHLEATRIYTQVTKEDLKRELDTYHPRRIIKKTKNK